MKRPLISLTAAALPLVFGSAHALASDARFQVPTTERAAQTSALLSHAANALGGQVSGEISNLWVFPTADSNLVFVRYTVGADEYLSLVALEGDRIVSMRELASPRINNPHWTASIGTGDAGLGGGF